VIDNCHKLKLVQQIGAGIDNIDIDYCANKDILVANTPATNNISVAEHTLFLMLSIAKKIKGAGEGLMKGRVQSVLGFRALWQDIASDGIGSYRDGGSKESHYVWHKGPCPYKISYKCSNRIIIVISSTIVTLGSTPTSI
jgi:lactate dehydrogenase-like 2-hydroxyacid dehydrogenase